MKTETIGCPETSVTNYQFRPCKLPEERRSHLHRGPSLKSRSNQVISLEIPTNIPKISDIQRICETDSKVSLKSAMPVNISSEDVRMCPPTDSRTLPPHPKPGAYQTHARIRISDSSVSLTNYGAIFVTQGHHAVRAITNGVVTHTVSGLDKP